MRAVLLLCLAANALAGFPKVVVDTDIGSDFDDSWSVTYLLSRSIPGDPARLFDFQLIQCSSFNTTSRARIVTKMLFDMNRFDVPVAVGLYTGENNVPQLPVVGNWQLDDWVAAGGVLTYGTASLEALLESATPDDPLHVVEIAPATSFGGVVGARPELATNAIVSAMSGSVYHGYGNSSSPEAEYNVYINVSASQSMYSASYLSPLMTAPLDTSGLLRCFDPEFTALIDAENDEHPYAAVLLKNYRVWCNCVPNASSGTDTLYDAQAAYQMASYAIARGVAPPAIANLSLEALHMTVNGTGFTVIDAAGQPVWAATHFPDGLAADTHAICRNLVEHIIRA